MDLHSIIKEAVTISEDASFKEAVALMIKEKTNSLLVVDDSGVLIGEITISELLHAVVPDYLEDDSIAAHFVTNEMFDEAITDTAEKQVKFFMRTDIEPVTLDAELMVIAVKAIDNKQVRIPVIDDQHKPIGIISRRGLKHIIGSILNITDEPNS